MGAFAPRRGGRSRLWRLGRGLLLLPLLIGLSPGASELASDGWHLVIEGHSAHASEHTDHSAPGPEHGCSGWHHTCPCHASVSFIGSEPLAILTRAQLAATLGARDQDRGPDGVAVQLERPPIT